MHACIWNTWFDARAACSCRTGFAELISCRLYNWTEQPKYMSSFWNQEIAKSLEWGMNYQYSILLTPRSVN